MGFRLMESRALRVLGIIEWDLGRRADAERHVTESAELAGRFNAEYEQALSQMTLVGWYAESGWDAEGRERDDYLRRAARTVLRRLGATPDLERLERPAAARAISR